MTRDHFIMYLEENGCEVVRVANQGYYVMRNPVTMRISGVPLTDPPLDASVCRVCKTLDVEPPNVSKGAKEVIELIDEKFNRTSENDKM